MCKSGTFSLIESRNPKTFMIRTRNENIVRQFMFLKRLYLFLFVPYVCVRTVTVANTCLQTRYVDRARNSIGENIPVTLYAVLHNFTFWKLYSFVFRRSTTVLQSFFLYSFDVSSRFVCVLVNIFVLIVLLFVQYMDYYFANLI